MSIRKNLTNIVIGSALALSIGCQQTQKFEQKTGVGVQIRTSGAKGDSSMSQIINVSGNGALNDIDGDGKQDIVFAINFFQVGRYDDYYVFYKRNLGNGDFDKPKYLYTIENRDDLRKAGIPYEIISDESDKGRYFLRTLQENEDSFK